MDIFINLRKHFKKAPELNCLEQSQAVLEELSHQSAQALDLVTSTIRNLTSINSEISRTRQDIQRELKALEAIDASLDKTQEKNTRIAERFAALIEVDNEIQS